MSSSPKRYNSKDVWHFFQKDASLQRYSCIFCLSRAAADPEECVQRYSKKSGTGTLRCHLYANHRDDWVAECDRRGIKITAKKAQKHVSAYRAAQRNQPALGSSGLNIPEYTYDGFIDMLVDFIVADDQSINIIESPFFRRLLLMLCEDLCDEDIPHRTFVWNHIQSRWKDYMKELQVKLQIGWVTIDNASNNDTMMVHLASSLNQRRIPFSARDNRIRGVVLKIKFSAWNRMKDLMPRYASIINAGITKLEDYLQDVEDVPAYTLAILITPSIKLNWHQKNQQDKVAWAKQLLIDSLKPYRRQMGANTPAPCRTTMADSWTDDALGSPILRFDNRNRSIQAEVDAYLVDGRVGSGCTIKFWQENREEYPTLSQLAIDILPIPGSAVPCERVFSSAKETMTSRCGRILPALMEALQILKFSLKKSLCLDFTTGTDREAEIAAMEATAANLTRLPDDITSYISHLLHGVESDEDTDEDREDVGADN
ncbi:hypothetical protein H1R20_g15043, partial [Candolleomyces eurysporus]